MNVAATRFDDHSQDTADIAPRGARPARFQRWDGNVCVVCGASLTIHEQVRGETCAQPICQHQFLRGQLQRRAEQERTLQSRALRSRRAVASKQGLPDEEALGLVIVPSNDLRLTNLPAKRIGRFRDRLQQILSLATADRAAGKPPPESDGVLSRPCRLDSAEQSLLGNACATCRGHCCRQGGDHAFIHVETIRRYMSARPQRRPAQILNDYLDRIGTKTYHQSCVYHVPGGCRLPREMRSVICNDYLCKGLNQLLDRARSSANDAVFVASTVNQDVRRTAIVEAHQVQMFNAHGDRIAETPGRQPSLTTTLVDVATQNDSLSAE